MFLFWLFCFCRLSEFIQTWNNTQKNFFWTFLSYFIQQYQSLENSFLYSYIKYSSRVSRCMLNIFDNSLQFTSILFHFHPFLRIHMSDAQTLKWEHFFSFIFTIFFCSVWNEEENVECERINVPRPTWLLYTQRAHTKTRCMWRFIIRLQRSYVTSSHIGLVWIIYLQEFFTKFLFEPTVGDS